MSDQADRLRARLDAVAKARETGQPYVPSVIEEQKPKQESMFQPAPAPVRQETAAEMKARLKKIKRESQTLRSKIINASLVIILGLGIGIIILANQKGTEQEIRIQADNAAKLLTQAIKEKKIFIGMPAAAVRASWGEPDKINTSNYNGVVKEQWIYRGEKNYVYLENGVVTSWQDR